MMISSRTQGIKNFFFDTADNRYPQVRPVMNSGSQALSLYMSPVQFARVRADLQLWREGIIEAENAWYPFRVKIQRVFQDTVINEQVTACWEKRQNLTVLRDFKVCNEAGEGDDTLKKIFRNMTTAVTGEQENTAQWFDDFIKYTIDAIGFGYTLIELGNVVNDTFPELSIIRRQNISPDRLNVSRYPNMVGGIKFLEDPDIRDWYVWVPTSTDLGVSKCGYGLFYKIAKTEIYLRNNITYNADFQQTFGQPIRKGKTSKTGEERVNFATDMANMGSQGWIIVDESGDDIEFVESKQIGASYKSFENFDMRMEKKISKVLLGHADALDSTPGKLGGGQDGEESPAAQAQADIQVKDGLFVQNVINNKLIPRMRKMGFKIPIEYHFEFVNNNENEEFRKKEDESNLGTATIALTMKNAGLKMKASYFEERTGIPTEEIVEPDPSMSEEDGGFGNKPKPGAKKPVKKTPVKEKLKNLYSAPNRR